MRLPQVATLSTYGGAKANEYPVENPLTDISADEHNEMAEDVAGMTQTVCRAWCTFQGHATTPTDPTSNVHGAVWGDGLAVKPTPSRSSTGVYAVTWPTSVTDELGNVHTVNMRRAWATVEGTTPYFCIVSMFAANVISVRIWNAAGTLTDPVGVNITVFAV